MFLADSTHFPQEHFPLGMLPAGDGGSPLSALQGKGMHQSCRKESSVGGCERAEWVTDRGRVQEEGTGGEEPQDSPARMAPTGAQRGWGTSLRS